MTMSPLPFWRRPSVWLLLQAVVLFALAVLWWQPETRWYSPDSYEYSGVLSRGPAAALSSRRTLGYPLLVEAAERLPGGLESIPYLHLALYLGAVVWFGCAAGSYLGSEAAGAIAATPLFWARLPRAHAPDLLADVPAAAFALATVACLLLALARPANRLAWAGVGLGTFLTYQVRPAYLFLVALVPLLGLALTWLDRRRAEPSPTEPPVAQNEAPWRRAAALCALTVVPFLLFCTLRWAVTGHFGLVSFGGINLIGIAGSMLTPEVVPRLPEATRPLARAILERRQVKRMRLEEGYDYQRWVSIYNRNVSGMALRAARKLPELAGLGTRSFWVEANRQLTALSWALIRLHPGLYARWVRDSMVAALLRMTESTALRLSAVALALSVAAAAWRRARDRRRSAAGPWTLRSWRWASPGTGLVLAAVAYAVASIALTVLVEPPIDRYVFAAELLLPSGLLALAAEPWRRASAGASPAPVPAP